jgi:dihydroneopterin aldolase
MSLPDHITLAGLELDCHIGVPDAEREQPQRLLLTARLFPSRGFRNLRDDLGQTIDYSEVSTQIRRWAAANTVKLIETMADDLATLLLRNYPLDAVELELRKFILPETRYVSVTLHREAPAPRS